MNTAAIKKTTIIQELSRIPDTSLDTVKSYLDTLLKDNQVHPSTNRSLKGIWQDAGFEKISNLEDKLQTIRQELQGAILTRKV